MFFAKRFSVLLSTVHDPTILFLPFFKVQGRPNRFIARKIRPMIRRKKNTFFTSKRCHVSLASLGCLESQMYSANTDLKVILIPYYRKVFQPKTTTLHTYPLFWWLNHRPEKKYADQLGYHSPGVKITHLSNHHLS